MAVCEALNALTPGDHDKRTALFNSGAEAVENAVKIARHVTGRPAVVVFDHAYHGRTNLTMALTAKNMPYRDSFGPFAPEVYRVPMSYPYRDPRGHDRRSRRRPGPSSRSSGRSAPATWPACSSSPSRARAGSSSPPAGFLPAIAAWCRSNGVPHGRRRDPDRVLPHRRLVRLRPRGCGPRPRQTAKALAGGMPLAAVTGRAELMDEVHLGGLGGTYGGNPVACAAALAAIDIMQEQDLAAAARRIGEVISVLAGCTGRRRIRASATSGDGGP